MGKSLLRVAAVGFAFSLIGCLGHRGPLAMPVPIPEMPGGQAKCKVAANQSTPLVTEWPASEKANLEALIRRGAVAVEYSGCAMRVLSQCALGGSYAWQRTSPAMDSFEINNEDELYAKLPLGAASLEGDLKRHGKLEVATQISGQVRLQGTSAHQIPSEGECRYATHVISALSVGAFTLSTSGGWAAGARGEVADVVSAGGKVGQGMKVVRAAGQSDACGLGTDQAPHPNCNSPIQVFLERIPGRGVEEAPPGMVQVDLVSGNAGQRWDVYVDDDVICTTPCTKWLDPNRPIFMRSRDDGLRMIPDRVKLNRLEPELAMAGNVQLQAHGTDFGKQATGIVFTSFGGMAMITGVSLLGVGCSDVERAGMCTGGLITLAVAAPVTAGAIWLILDSMPRAELMPVYRAEVGGGQPPLTVALGPTGVFGTF